MSLYAQQLVRYPELGISLDFSKLPLDDAFLSSMQGRIDRAFADMKALESGAIANPDEKRMVGHYWLRNSALAPTPELKAAIDGPCLLYTSHRQAGHGGEKKNPAHGGGRFPQSVGEVQKNVGKDHGNACKAYGFQHLNRSEAAAEGVKLPDQLGRKFDGS